jgi:hypothetical protein
MNEINELTGRPIHEENMTPITIQNDEDFTSINVGLLPIKSFK